MGRGALPQPGPGRGTRRSWLKVRRKKLQRLRSCAILRRGADSSGRGAHAARWVVSRAHGPFARDVRACHRRQASGRGSMRAWMVMACTTCPHRCGHLPPRRCGKWQLLGTVRRGHGLQSIWPRGSHWDSTGCNLFCDAAVCVARERARRSRPLSPRVSTAVREVVFAVSQGALGLIVGGPIDLVWSVRVLWSMLWRQGACGRD